METKEALDAALSASLADDEMIAQLNLKLLKAYKSEEEFWSLLKAEEPEIGSL